MFKLIVQSLLLLSFFSEVLKGEADKPWVYQSRVIDCSNGQSIAYADIFNESSRRRTIADSSGLFKILTNPGDTLIIQSMGYYGKILIIRNRIINSSDSIELCPESYGLGNVQIDLPLSYKAFQKRFLEIQPDRGFKIEGVPEPKILEIPLLLDTNYLNSAEIKPDGTVILPFSYFYKENRSNRKVFYLERQNREQFLIDKKYNRELIERMTGLTGDSITDFMVFCSFSHEFLYEASELEIVQVIDKKYQEYLNREEEYNAE
jgi:hypothetical protein